VNFVALGFCGRLLSFFVDKKQISLFPNMRLITD
jgi:hypothetical protein